MKRLWLYLTIVLGSSLAFAGFAQLAPLPSDAIFDQAVEFKTAAGGESLQVMVAALARSINLTAIVDDVPDKTITYDIGDPKPFRQVWNIVLSLNDLDYLLLENDVVVVGTPESVAKLRKQSSTPGVQTPAGEAAMSEIVQRFYKVSSDVNEVAGFLEQELPEVSINIFETLNIISVRGTQEQQDEVAAILSQIDRTIEAVPLEQRVYTLSNAKAADLAQVLEASNIQNVAGVADVQDGQVDQLQLNQQEKEFTVTADERTNSLIVTATAAVQARIAELIPQLDVPVPQVNVQVRIQEITTTAAQQLGINLNAGLGSFATTILDGGLNFIFDAQKAISGLNIGAVLDTLERQGLSRRVDDSNLTVLNNGKAQIQSGGTIFISIAGADENIERTIPYGVQIDVQPQISADGRVILAVDAKVEDVLSETADPSFLELSTRKVSSTVSLSPGQTIVLGGLLQNSFTDTTNRVPVLGSIPLIGSLFSSTTVEESNTELLLIINAVVIE